MANTNKINQYRAFAVFKEKGNKVLYQDRIGGKSHLRNYAYNRDFIIHASSITQARDLVRKEANKSNAQAYNINIKLIK